ncbi:ATP-binding protein, partial [Patescibacteria group bacterium]|nr:ATP-binding protein [Patescibacteria group bacterium]
MVRFAQIEQMTQTLEEIYNAGLRFLEPLTFEKTYKIVAEEARRLVQADSVSIHLKQKNELKRVYASSPTLYAVKSRKRGFIYQTYKSHQPLTVCKKQVVEAHPELKTTKIQSWALIPLSYLNQAVGVLTIQSHEEKYFDDKKMKILNLFASMASLAIRKAQLYAEAQKALQNRDLFISMAAHELRTPVTTIYGYTQLLYNKLGKKKGLEARWIKALHHETHCLSALVKELLETAHIKSGKLHYTFQEYSFRKIVKTAVGNFKFNHPEQEVVFEDLLGKKKDMIIVDHDKLIQAIINILDNAVKFSPLHTKITIRLLVKSQNYTLQIIDQGKGISKEDLPNIFDVYYKSKDTSIPGMGLGLFLCKNIIEAHRGSI